MRVLRCRRRALRRARHAVSKTYEKGMKQRVVIVEFHSVQKVTEAHESPAYQEVPRVLGNGADRDMRVVKGVG